MVRLKNFALKSKLSFRTLTVIKRVMIQDGWELYLEDYENWIVIGNVWRWDDDIAMLRLRWTLSRYIWGKDFK